MRLEPNSQRMPGWMRRQVECGPELRRVERILADERLNTVCDGARCPNRGECYSAGTATFMIMGDRCTRDCGFCAVTSGTPRPLDRQEPRRVARAAAEMGLRHVVITSVTRDDLPDGGAGHFALVVRRVREALPGVTIEVLVPDFRGRRRDVLAVAESKPDVFNHNMETVEGLYGRARPGADYGRSLEVLARASAEGLRTKSGFMVGLGESRDEVRRLLEDLLRAGCGMVTAGQYLRPAARNLPVERYWEPAEFEELEAEALELGFGAVACGPLVRSSYFAERMLGVGAPSRESRESSGVAPARAAER